MTETRNGTKVVQGPSRRTLGGSIVVITISPVSAAKEEQLKYDNR